MPNPRLSDAEHKARGTRPSPKVEPAPAKDKQGRPEKPTWLSPTASAEWDKLLPLLESRGSVTPADYMALTLFCETVSRYVGALRSLEENGQTITVTVLDSNGKAHESTKMNPSLRIAENCERSIRQLLPQLGLTPASREKIKPAAEPEDDESNSSLFDRIRAGEFK